MLQMAKADADRHRKLIQKLAADVAAMQATTTAELVEFVRNADARLAVVVADEAAVVAQFSSFPKACLPFTHLLLMICILFVTL